MSGILLRNARIARIRELLSVPVIIPGTNVGVQVASRNIVSHPGMMTDEQRREFFIHVPAVSVACMGTSNTEYAEDQVTGNGRFTPIYVMSVVVFARDVATDTINVNRGDVAQAIAETIAGDVWFNRPDETASDIAKFRMTNDWLAIDDKNDVAVWALEWEEGAELAPPSEDDLPDFVTARTEFEIAENGDEPQAIGNVTFDGVDDPDLPEEP